MNKLFNTIDTKGKELRHGVTSFSSNSGLTTDVSATYEVQLVSGDDITTLTSNTYWITDPESLSKINSPITTDDIGKTSHEITCTRLFNHLAETGQIKEL